MYGRTFMNASLQSNCQHLDIFVTQQLWGSMLNAKKLRISRLRGCNQKFPDGVDNEIYAYNNKHSEHPQICGTRVEKQCSKFMYRN